MNKIYLYQRLIEFKHYGERVHGCLDAACELIQNRLDDPGSVELTSILAVLEAARDGQGDVIHEIARVASDLDAESAIMARIGTMKDPLGGDS